MQHETLDRLWHLIFLSLVAEGIQNALHWPVVLQAKVSSQGCSGCCEQLLSRQVDVSYEAMAAMAPKSLI